MPKPISSLAQIKGKVLRFGAGLNWDSIHQLHEKVLDLCRQTDSQEAEALHACKLLVAAYKAGKEGSHIDWSDVDLAHEQACKALGITP